MTLRGARPDLRSLMSAPPSPTGRRPGGVDRRPRRVSDRARRPPSPRRHPGHLSRPLGPPRRPPGASGPGRGAAGPVCSASRRSASSRRWPKPGSRRRSASPPAWSFRPARGDSCPTRATRSGSRDVPPADHLRRGRHEAGRPLDRRPGASRRRRSRRPRRLGFGPIFGGDHAADWGIGLLAALGVGWVLLRRHLPGPCRLPRRSGPPRASSTWWRPRDQSPREPTMTTIDAGLPAPPPARKGWLRTLIGRSPLTDPRSLLGSLVLHARAAGGRVVAGLHGDDRRARSRADGAGAPGRARRDRQPGERGVRHRRRWRPVGGGDRRRRRAGQPRRRRRATRRPTPCSRRSCRPATSATRPRRPCPARRWPTSAWPPGSAPGAAASGRAAGWAAGSGRASARGPSSSGCATRGGRMPT